MEVTTHTAVLARVAGARLVLIGNEEWSSMMGNDAAEGGAVQGHNAREAEAAGQAPAPLPAQRPGQGVHHGQRPRPLIAWQAPSHLCF